MTAKNDILTLMVVRPDSRGRLQNLVGLCLMIRGGDAEEVEGYVFWLQRLQLSIAVWYEALAAYTPESLLATRLIAIRLNGRLVFVRPYSRIAK